MLTGLHDPESGELLDRGIVTSYPAPASYTGEDMVEISCHGGYLIPGLLVEHALEAGARMAEPGEFTRRAYLNGKMDLLQAEAVCDLVERAEPCAAPGGRASDGAWAVGQDDRGARVPGHAGGTARPPSGLSG